VSHVAFIWPKARDRRFAVAHGVRNPLCRRVFLGALRQVTTEGCGETHNGFLCGEITVNATYEPRGSLSAGCSWRFFSAVTAIRFDFL
jgi:hypothetical protein